MCDGQSKWVPKNGVTHLVSSGEILKINDLEAQGCCPSKKSLNHFPSFCTQDSWLRSPIVKENVRLLQRILWQMYKVMTHSIFFVIYSSTLIMEKGEYPIILRTTGHWYSET